MTCNSGQRLSRPLLMFLLLAGCRSYDGQKIRREHAASYPAALLDKTVEALAQQDAMGLEDCIRLAMENNLETRSAAIEKRIAKLERRTAFANFLPVVNLDYSHYEFDPAISLPLSDDETVRLDKARSLLWNAGVSVFNPATWFLYGMYTRGEEIADQAVLYTKQMTALQVTVLYFQCLTLEQVERSLEVELEAADALHVEVAALQQEGMVSGWQADQAGVYARAQRAELARTQRMYRQARSALLAAVKHARTLVDLSKAQERQAEASLEIARKNLADAVVVAPISGTVSERLHEPGEMANPGNPILRIDDPSVVEVAAFLPVQYYPEVVPGRTAMNVKVGQTELRDLVACYRSPTVNPRLRTFEVKCLLENPPAGVVPGAMANVTLVFETRQGLGVPSSSIQDRAGRPVIFLVRDSKAEQVVLTTGIEAGGWTEIRQADLRENEPVVTLGQNMLSQGTTVDVQQEEK